MNKGILEEKHKTAIAYTVSGLFLALSAYLIANEKFWYIAIIPAMLAVLGLYVYKLHWVILLTAFVTPIAVELSDLSLGISISLPSEPLMVGILIIATLKLLFEDQHDGRIIRHPVTLAVIFSLVWMFFTSVTSELPVVSFKYFLSRLWFVVPFFFLGIPLFKRFKYIKTFNWIYIIPLIYVIVYTTNVHARHGFDEDVSHWAMSPFYNDHTAYGAILALMLPFTLVSTFYKGYSKRYRTIAGIVSFILLGALFLSYSRAAWLSFVGAFGVLMIMVLKIRFRYVFLVLGILVGLFFSFRPQIIDYMEDNDQDSSGNFKKHVQSAYNISTDASNLERINRWQSALRLFEERPVLGWGPGTYQFVYAPYQRSKEKTIISTNFGDMGNAHSEYLGPLSESGVLGIVYVFLLAFVGLNRAVIVYRKSKNKEVRMMALAALLGLTTYWIHGFLNIFLDTDKLSVPVWGYLAVIVALDLYHRDRPPEDEENKKPAKD